MICLQPYPVLKVHAEKFKKEVERLVILEVLEKSNGSKWGAPYFAKTKSKTDRVSFLSDFINLNKKLKINPYPMTNINLLKSKGLIYIK